MDTKMSHNTTKQQDNKIQKTAGSDTKLRTCFQVKSARHCQGTEVIGASEQFKEEESYHDEMPLQELSSSPAGAYIDEKDRLVVKRQRKREKEKEKKRHSPHPPDRKRRKCKSYDRQKSDDF